MPTGAERSRQIGVGFAYLLLEQRKWVHRRVERVVLIDDRTVSRRTSVDFTYPLPIPSVKRMRGLETGDAMVPLALLNKELLTRFSTEDQGGRPLPVLTARQNSEHASRALIGVARTLRRQAGKQLSKETARILLAVAELPPVEAQYVVYSMRRLRDLNDRGEAELKLSEVANLFAGLINPELEAEVAGLAPRHQEISALRDNEPFFRLLTELATRFVLLVPVPESELEQRRIIKFSFDEEFQINPALGMIRRQIGAVAEGCGYQARTFGFEGMRPGDAESTHLEVAAPGDIEATRAEFFASGPQGPDDQRSSAGPAQQAVHLQLRNIPRNWGGSAFVDFQTSVRGAIDAGLALAILTTVTLALGSTRTDQIEAEAGTALFLLIPTLLAALLVRPGEHRLSTRLLSGVRILVAAIGLCSFVAAGALAADWDSGTLADIWCAAAIGAGVFSALLAASWILVVARRRKFR